MAGMRQHGIYIYWLERWADHTEFCLPEPIQCLEWNAASSYYVVSCRTTGRDFTHERTANVNRGVHPIDGFVAIGRELFACVCSL